MNIASRFAQTRPSTEADTGLSPVISYEGRGAAHDLFSCRDSEILLDGPAGTGKTRAILEKINLMMVKYPGSRGLICRSTRSSMTESVLVTYEQKVLPQDPNPEVFPPVKNIQRRIRQSYEYPNGSSLIVGGLDDTMKIMSTEYDVIAVFEATEITEADWETLLSRLRNGVIPYQQAIADCNPNAPGHWLNRRPEPPTSLMTRLVSRHEDNPTLYKRVKYRTGPRSRHRRAGVRTVYELTSQGEAYIGKLDRLTGHRYWRLRRGKWTAAEGLIYGEWNASLHVIPKFTPPHSWRRFRSIDFGYNNPFVCQWWAVDEDGRMYLYREIYFSRRIVEDHARQIRLLSVGENIEFTVADHDREDRETLHRHGIETIPAFKTFEPGRDAVKARLLPDGNDPAPGRPRLFLMRGALYEIDTYLSEEKKLPFCTEQEWDNYVYKKTKTRAPGTGAEEISEKEEPVDKDNHGMDAARYAVAAADNLIGLNTDWIGDSTTAVQ